ncbi:uncharacterized protein LOC18101387 isoform X2 [Populus trichocarpa]|uniref:uncharacterized protein LOC18101387 isoform X2 n=1 Tax=Populus trichocarpa TaxID=3694 RepID=UPI002279B8BC|nr:uncharacterized protein LOC18101387 isoform X2 [Populus trichocarpa]
MIIILPFMWNPLSISPYWVYTQWSQVLSFTTHSSLHFSHFSSKFQKQIMSAPKCCDCEWLKWKSSGSWAEKEHAVQEDIIIASEEIVNNVDDGYMDDTSLVRQSL